MTTSSPPPTAKRRKLSAFLAHDETSDGSAVSAGSPRASQETKRKIAKVSVITQDADDHGDVTPPSDAAREPASYEAAMEALNRAFMAFVAAQLARHPHGDFTQPAQEYIAYAHSLRVQYGLAVRADPAPAPETPEAPPPPTVELEVSPTTPSPFGIPASAGSTSAFGVASGSSVPQSPTTWGFSGSAAPASEGGSVFSSAAWVAVPASAPFASGGSSSGFSFGAPAGPAAPTTAPAFGYIPPSSSSSGFSFGSVSGNAFGASASSTAASAPFSYGSSSAAPAPSGFDGFLASTNTYGFSSIWADPVLLQLKADVTSIVRQQVVYSSPQTEVWRGMWKTTMSVALKRLAVSRQDMTNALVFATNIKTVASLQHPRIVALVGLEWVRTSEFQVASEFMERGDLRTLLDSRDVSVSLTWDNFKCQVAIDVVDALAFIHSQTSRLPLLCLPSSRKVLLTNEGRAKLSVVHGSDFALQRNSHAVRYMASEMIVGGAASDAADVYSLGVLLCELDTTDTPYYDAISPDGAKMGDELVAQQVVKGLLTPTVSSQCPEPIAQVIKECTTQDPALRPTAASVAYTLREILKNEL